MIQQINTTFENVICLLFIMFVACFFGIAARSWLDSSCVLEWVKTSDDLIRILTHLALMY